MNFRYKNIRLSEKGFTLNEIIFGVIILVAVLVMVIPRFMGRPEKTKISTARSDIEAHFATALKLYELDNGHFPSTQQGLVALRVLPTQKPVPQNWNGAYIEKEPIDPWGRPYVYLSPGKNRPDYDLSSNGKDKESNEDDIKNW